MAACGLDATSGRGLALVAALAGSWGIDNQDDGKIVWAEIGQPTGRSPEDCLDLRQVTNVDHALELVDRAETTMTS